MSDIDHDAFYKAVVKLAEEDGVEYLIMCVPGVWDAVSDYYNNDALDDLNAAQASYVRVEWDPDYWGGDYEDVGHFEYLSAEGLTEDNIGERFEEQTGCSADHIIFYSLDELYDSEENPIEE